MNKGLIVATLLSGLSFAHMANAALNNVLFKFDCPTKLNNLSSSITGIGSEQIASGPEQNMQFKGEVPYETPLDMSSYFNSNTKYDEVTGKITCQFHSSEGWPVIYVSYDPVHVSDGIVVRQTSKEIDVKVPLGFAK